MIIPYWWLWLISLPIWGFGIMLAGHRIVPLLTNGFIETVFKTRDDVIESVPFQLKAPWKVLDVNASDQIERKLLKRLVHGHPLKGLQIKAIAVRIDCNCVLLYTSNASQPIAIVSLGTTEKNKHTFLSPPTKLFMSWDTWRKSEYQDDVARYASENSL